MTPDEEEERTPDETPPEEAPSEKAAAAPAPEESILEDPAAEAPALEAQPVPGPIVETTAEPEPGMEGDAPEPFIEPPAPELEPEPTPTPSIFAKPAPPPEPEPPQSFAAPPQQSAPAPSDSQYAYEPAYEPEPSVHESYADQDPYVEPQDRPVAADAYAGFGDAEIPMPPSARRGDTKRARDARRNLDLDLGRIKRRKRFGLFITTITVLFVALVIAPVTWAAAYLFADPPATVLMMQRAAEGQSIHHYPIPITRMSPHIIRAVIASEDGNFCTHDGFDVAAIQRAMESNEDGGRMRGGSTISQQTAKNLFLWPERSWVRKGFETYFTALIEFMWPKRRIMEAYLNAAEWGDGNFGIEAAARARFGVSAADLTPLQAARLAAVLPSPNRWRADSPGPYVRRRAGTIVQRAQVVRNEHMASCVLALDRVR